MNVKKKHQIKCGRVSKHKCIARLAVEGPDISVMEDIIGNLLEPD